MGASVGYLNVCRVMVTFSRVFVELVRLCDATSHDCSCTKHQTNTKSLHKTESDEDRKDPEFHSSIELTTFDFFV